MALQPGLDLVVLVGRVIIDNGMDFLVFRNGPFDLVEETNELLMPVALHVLANHCAIQHIQFCKQGGRAVSFIIMGHRRTAPLFSGNPGWVRSSACICDFSSIDSTTAWAGGET